MHISAVVKHGALFAIALSALISLSPLCGSAEARRHHSTSHTSGRSTHSQSSLHRGRHHTTSKKRSGSTAARPRYAYPIDIFMMDAPHDDYTLLPADEALKIRYAFQSGSADCYTPTHLVRAGAFNFYPLHGGIFERRDEVKYIVVHSTETGVPQDARHVINSWSSGGRRHPGAQFIVDRDGTIFQCVDPKYATVHVNIFKTLPGINNDNSIGIEMCHTGSQDYPPEQRASVIRLVSYLQDRFHVLNDNVITHRYAQQGDHTDPVAFDFNEFLARKDDFHNKALAMRHTASPPFIQDADVNAPPAAVYLEMHQGVPVSNQDGSSALPPSAPPTARNTPAPAVKTVSAPPAPAPAVKTVSAPPAAAPAVKTVSAQPAAAPAATSTNSLKELQQALQGSQRVFTSPRPQPFSQPSALQTTTPVSAAPGNLPLRGEIELPPSTLKQLSTP